MCQERVERSAIDNQIMSFSLEIRKKLDFYEILIV
jgi:hypothetical protein